MQHCNSPKEHHVNRALVTLHLKFKTVPQDVFLKIFMIVPPPTIKKILKTPLVATDLPGVFNIALLCDQLY